jgi:hypothetical protein
MLVLVILDSIWILTYRIPFIIPGMFGQVVLAIVTLSIRKPPSSGIKKLE